MTKHESDSELKSEGLTFMLFTFISYVAAGLLFAIGFLNFGLVSLSIGLLMMFLSILITIKLHGRYIRSDMYEIAGKTLEDFCTCEECKSRRES